MKYKIYKPAKSAMQSGLKHTKKWLLVPLEEKNSRSVNNIMNWVSSDNTENQLKFSFATKEAAIKFAQDQGFEFEIEQPHFASLKKKSYAENFTS